MTTTNEVTNLENLKSCKDAVEKVIEIINKNEALIQRNDVKAREAAALHSAWLGRKKEAADQLLRWQQKKGEYAIYAGIDSNNTFYTTTCFQRSSGVCHGQVNPNALTDSTCRSEASQKGLFDAANYVTGPARQDCKMSNDLCFATSAGQRVQCIRTQAGIDAANVRYQQAKPPAFTEPDVVAGFASAFPPPTNDARGNFVFETPTPLGGVVQCCSNSFNVEIPEIQIDAAGRSNLIDIQNNVQSCSQKVEQSINTIQGMPESTATNAPGTDNTTTARPVTTTPTTTPSTMINRYLGLAIGGGICVIFVILMIVMLVMSRR